MANGTVKWFDPTKGFGFIDTKMRWLIISSILAFANAADAGEIFERIKAQNALRVGITGDYKPFAYLNSDGSYVGADIQMAQRLAAKLGVKVEFVKTTWANLENDYAFDRFDIAMGGVTVLSKRSAIGPFSHTIYVDGKRPITACKDAHRFNSIEAINNPEVRVVVNPGGANEDFARKNFPRAKITIHSDNASAFEEIAQGRQDVMTTDGIEVDNQATIYNHVLCAAAVSSPFTRLEKAYWVRPDNELLAAVNAFVDEEARNGHWKAVLDASLAPK